MPAQPLSNFNPSAKVIIDTGTARLYPSLATTIAETIAAWSHVEMALGELLVAMLGANAAPAISMYNALTSSVSQIAAIKAAARSSLATDDFLLFEALYSRHKPLAKSRNYLAHWIWAHSPDIPDAILLCNPASLITYNASKLKKSSWLPAWSAISAEIAGVKIKKAAKDFDRSSIYVYGRKDLEEILADVRELMADWTMFHMAITPRYPMTLIHDKLREILSSEPRTALALSRLHAGQKTSHPTQPSPPQSEPPE